MHRLIKRLVFFTLIFAIVKTSYADEFFFRINHGLERVGQDAFNKTNSAPFKGEVYRLPDNFKLGIGDTIILELWGKIEEKYTLVIDKDGKILVPRIGSIYVIGLSIDAAKQKMSDALARKYANVQFDVSLGNVQDIRISVLGNVNKPGVFAISPFAKILDGLIIAGGINGNGSLRKIKLIRNNEIIDIFDFYKFIFKGDESKNISLMHGDKIFVPLVENLIAVRGDIVQPGIYEMDKGAVLSDLVDMASGIVESKFTHKIQIVRLDKETKNIVIFKEIVFDDFTKIKGTENDFKLDNNDSIIVTTIYNFIPFTKEIFKTFTIEGEIKNPGRYYIEDGEKLSDLIKRTGGLTDFAYPEGAVYKKGKLVGKQGEIHAQIVKAKEKEILDEESWLDKSMITKEEKEMLKTSIERKKAALNLFAAKKHEGRIIIDLVKILKEGKDDIILENGDELYVPLIPEWVMVSGAVYNPESVVFEEGTGLDYYLQKVGGMTRGAKTDNIYIIKPSGIIETKSASFGAIQRGSIIVVPEEDIFFEK